FDVASDMQDLVAVTLLIGSREDDLHGISPTDLSKLPLLHGLPSAQREHCLRDRGDDEPDGSALALTRCAEFIHEEIAQALTGLDAAGNPDLNSRDELHLVLQIRGSVDVRLPRFWLHLGQAVH